MFWKIWPRLGAALSVLALAFLLAACGGGGDSYEPAAGVTSTTTAANFAAPAVEATSAGATQAAHALAAPKAALAYPTDPFGGVGEADAVEQLFAFGEAQYAQYFPPKQTTQVVSFPDGRAFRYRGEYSTGNYVGVATVTTADVVRGGVYVMGRSFNAPGTQQVPVYVGMLLDFVTPKTPWWPLGALNLIGERVTGWGSLGAASITIGDTAWKQAVQNGTIKPVETGMIMTDFENRSTVFMLFDRGIVHCMTPVHRDDGSAIGSWTSVGSVCKTDNFDWVQGTSEGLLRHYPAGNVCYHMRWSIPKQTIVDDKVACP